MLIDPDKNDEIRDKWDVNNSTARQLDSKNEIVEDVLEDITELHITRNSSDDKQ